MKAARNCHLACLTLILACGEPPREELPATADSAPVARDSTSHNAIATRSVIFMEASGADLDSLRKRYSEEDFAVVADDGMYYRATAYEYLEKLQLPITRVEGMRPLSFVVNGEPRIYNFGDSTWLDVIVLYEPGREPRAIAAVDVHEAATFFGLPTPADTIRR